MKTIFILEDENSIREGLGILFSGEGYKTIGCSSIVDFKRLHQTCKIDLYLLDVRLPDGSGIDVCNDLKREKLTATTPVLLMSAHARVLEMENRCAPEAFIPKPFDLDDLLIRIANLISSA